jgi:type IV pilus assembly protein PilE
MTAQRGFTLIELMIVVVVIAILAVVGYPAYTDHVNRGRRAEGKTALLKAAQQMERYYTLNNCYPSAACAPNNAATSAAALAAAGILAYSGSSAADGWYTVSVTLNPQDYTLTATPVPRFSDPKCGNLTLNNAGLKQVSGTDTVANCWGK